MMGKWKDVTGVDKAIEKISGNEIWHCGNTRVVDEKPLCLITLLTLFSTLGPSDVDLKHHHQGLSRRSS